MQIQKNPDGKIIVSGDGITLEVNSHYILKETMHKDSLKILSRIIEKEFIKALETFKDSNENTPIIREKLYHKEVFSENIKNIALIERDLIYKLHIDGECIELSPALQEIRDYAHSVWKYCADYGYISIKKTEL